jgi:UDP-N-acetylmuramoyl-tripeptide--D-alanyl-D-alanine ligase
MMDTATAARAVNGRMLGGNVRFARVATDTRTLAAGDLFVAIKGERFDGHDFVGAAFERGAVAALVGESRADTLAGNLVVVRSRWRRWASSRALAFRFSSGRGGRQQRQDDRQGDVSGDPPRTTASSACW